MWLFNVYSISCCGGWVNELTEGLQASEDAPNALTNNSCLEREILRVNFDGIYNYDKINLDMIAVI